MNKPLVSYLILDFERHDESHTCISSIHRYSKFPYEVIYLSNGGNQEYVLNYYNLGLIDKLILNYKNNGLGFGTTDLFRFCDTKYAIYLQSDQFLRRTFAQDELDYLISFLDTKKQDKTIKSVSLAGDHCQGGYGERCHLIETEFYNSIPDKPNGGAGPYHDKPWNEGYIQEFYRKNDYMHYIYPDVMVVDNGCFSVRQNPDGSLWKHRTDTKTLELLNGPIKEKYVYPNFTDSEWDGVLKDQIWPKDQIPEQDKKNSFQCWK